MNKYEYRCDRCLIIEEKWLLNAEVTEDGKVRMRAENSGEGDGRVYGINITATDSSGNDDSASTFVNVNKSKKKEAVDSGQNYDAT
jgi:hypothetical protein